MLPKISLQCILKIFILIFLIMYEKGLIRKLINFKVYYVTDWTINNYNTHIVQYIKSKGNKTMKFGQQIEYYLKKYFFGISCTKYGGESSPRPFFENPKLSISLDQ